MKTLLVINASGRLSRSISRRLTQHAVETFKTDHPSTDVIYEELGLTPPPPVNEEWIRAAFCDSEQRTPEMHAALQTSEGFIDRLSRADAVILGTPIYNFGMPAQLKAYVDQIVRVGRTFAFNHDGPSPYHALLASKPMLVITAAGDGSMFPGGPLHHLNFLEPHIQTVFGFIGFTELTFVRVGYEEFQDERLKQSLTQADRAIEAWTENLSGVLQS